MHGRAAATLPLPLLSPGHERRGSNMAEPVVVEAVVQEAVVAEAAVAGHAENVEEKCRGELLGCMDPCGQYPVWVGVPPELKKKGAKNIHFCLNCRRYLRVRAARVRTVDLSTEEMQKTWLKQGGPGPWKSKQERFAVFNYAGKCTPGKAIVIWASNISESSIQAHGSPIPQEWCEEVAGKQCLILEWRSHDFQPRKTRKRKRAAASFLLAAYTLEVSDRRTPLVTCRM